MKLKLDENFDVRLVPLLAAEGFDADTVVSEGLSSSPDETIYDTCKAIGRTLVTLDLDFANPIHFPPVATEGIIVVRPPQAILPMIQATLWSVLPQLKTGSVKGKLWIVEPGRIREHQPGIDDEENEQP
jgi:predicted nuclease of predicted toxin-antitoxin system